MNPAFVEGNGYLITKTLTKFTQSFHEGQKLVFVDEMYSRYDGLTTYHFQDASTGVDVYFEITDDENLRDWLPLFRAE